MVIHFNKKAGAAWNEWKTQPPSKRKGDKTVKLITVFSKPEGYFKKKNNKPKN